MKKTSLESQPMVAVRATGDVSMSQQSTPKVANAPIRGYIRLPSESLLSDLVDCRH